MPVCDRTLKCLSNGVQCLGGLYLSLQGTTRIPYRKTKVFVVPLFWGEHWPTESERDKYRESETREVCLFVRERERQEDKERNRCERWDGNFSAAMLPEGSSLLSKGGVWTCHSQEGMSVEPFRQRLRLAYVKPLTLKPNQHADILNCTVSKNVPSSIRYLRMHTNMIVMQSVICCSCLFYLSLPCMPVCWRGYDNNCSHERTIYDTWIF